MKLWTRWRRLAHKAAVVQSNIVLFAVYFAIVVPVAFVRRVSSKPRRTPPGWQPVPASPDERSSAHQQF